MGTLFYVRKKKIIKNLRFKFSKCFVPKFFVFINLLENFIFLEKYFFLENLKFLENFKNKKFLEN